jgi:hypothetical protein
LVEATNINHNFKLESIIEAKTNLLENTQPYQTQFYISRLNILPDKSEFKHAFKLQHQVRLAKIFGSISN